MLMYAMLSLQVSQEPHLTYETKRESVSRRCWSRGLTVVWCVFVCGGFWQQRWHWPDCHHIHSYVATRLRGCVIRLSLGRRLVNLLPVAQRTNAFTNGVDGRTTGRWSWVRISRPPWKRFLKKSVFPHVKNLMNHSPWVPRDNKRTSE